MIPLVVYRNGSVYNPYRKREYYLQNRTKMIEYAKQYYKNNKEKVNAKRYPKRYCVCGNLLSGRQKKCTICTTTRYCVCGNVLDKGKHKCAECKKRLCKCGSGIRLEKNKSTCNKCNVKHRTRFCKCGVELGYKKRKCDECRLLDKRRDSAKRYLKIRIANTLDRCEND